MKSTLNIHWKDRCWSWSANTLTTWCQEPWKYIGWHWKGFCYAVNYVLKVLLWVLHIGGQRYKREANLKVIVTLKEWNDGLSQRIHCRGNEKWLCLEYALKMKQVGFIHEWTGCRVMRIWWTWGWRLPAWGIGWIRRVLVQWELLRLK